MSPGHSAIVERSLRQYPLTVAAYRCLMVLITDADSSHTLGGVTRLRGAMIPCLWRLVVDASEGLQLRALEEWGVLMAVNEANKVAFRRHRCDTACRGCQGMHAAPFD